LVLIIYIITDANVLKGCSTTTKMPKQKRNVLNQGNDRHSPPLTPTCIDDSHQPDMDTTEAISGSEENSIQEKDSPSDNQDEKKEQGEDLNNNSEDNEAEQKQEEEEGESHKSEGASDDDQDDKIDTEDKGSISKLVKSRRAPDKKRRIKDTAEDIDASEGADSTYPSVSSDEEDDDHIIENDDSEDLSAEGIQEAIDGAEEEISDVIDFDKEEEKGDEESEEEGDEYSDDDEMDEALSDSEGDNEIGDSTKPTVKRRKKIIEKNFDDNFLENNVKIPIRSFVDLTFKLLAKMKVMHLVIDLNDRGKYEDLARTFFYNHKFHWLTALEHKKQQMERSESKSDISKKPSYATANLYTNEEDFLHVSDISMTRKQHVEHTIALMNQLTDKKNDPINRIKCDKFIGNKQSPSLSDSLINRLNMTPHKYMALHILVLSCASHLRYSILSDTVTIFNNGVIMQSINLNNLIAQGKIKRSRITLPCTDKNNKANDQKTKRITTRCSMSNQKLSLSSYKKKHPEAAVLQVIMKPGGFNGIVPSKSIDKDHHWTVLNFFIKAPPDPIGLVRLWFKGINKSIRPSKVIASKEAVSKEIVIKEVAPKMSFRKKLKSIQQEPSKPVVIINTTPSKETKKTKLVEVKSEVESKVKEIPPVETKPRKKVKAHPKKQKAKLIDFVKTVKEAPLPVTPPLAQPVPVNQIPTPAENKRKRDEISGKSDISEEPPLKKLKLSRKITLRSPLNQYNNSRSVDIHHIFNGLDKSNDLKHIHLVMGRLWDFLAASSLTIFQLEMEKVIGARIKLYFPAVLSYLSTFGTKDIDSEDNCQKEINAFYRAIDQDTLGEEDMKGPYFHLIMCLFRPSDTFTNEDYPLSYPATTPVQSLEDFDVLIGLSTEKVRKYPSASHLAPLIRAAKMENFKDLSNLPSNFQINISAVRRMSSGIKMITNTIKAKRDIPELDSLIFSIDRNIITMDQNDQRFNTFCLLIFHWLFRPSVFNIWAAK
jgi:hypothetical protein